jgi:hypothetical protein
MLDLCRKIDPSKLFDPERVIALIAPPANPDNLTSNGETLT